MDGLEVYSNLNEPVILSPWGIQHSRPARQQVLVMWPPTNAAGCRGSTQGGGRQYEVVGINKMKDKSWIFECAEARTRLQIPRKNVPYCRPGGKVFRDRTCHRRERTALKIINVIPFCFRGMCEWVWRVCRMGLEHAKLYYRTAVQSG